MTKRNLVSVVLKLLGIYAVIQSANYVQPTALLIQATLSNRVQPGINGAIVMGSFLPLVFLISAAVILIRFSDALAALICRDNTSEQVNPSFSPEDLQTVAFATVGVLVFADSLPRFLQVLMTLHWLRQANDSMYSQLLNSAGSQAIIFIVQLVLAFVLFFKARGFAALWSALPKTRPMGKGGNQSEPGNGA